ncbi:hypothetical protein [Caldisalinibacter kiritimatiensis]|uniref:Uncharacterized protein n=1 Tax=Caldisalinibacter kiritimatiensis TaxID=1304284 RepID=R1CAN0_9FIRM|nr:hypothetical protein [Caldisalinibacter kiritimatiensis]EOC99374.1 hypothetical protein L21TH_2632 [Caldisalinibacter kiritimatiensis]
MSWKNELQKDRRKLIASIPFTRNIVEYLEDTSDGKSDNYEFLTKLLHIKDGSENITVEQLEEVFNNVYKERKEFENKDIKVFSILFEEAEKIFNEPHEGVKVENKLVLSIASRLYAEKFMISKLEKVSRRTKFKGNQTPKLIEEYKKHYPSNEKEISILEQINMMAVENIHVNSFMYEPIIDLTDYYLKDIYECAKELYINECKTADELVAVAMD